MDLPDIDDETESEPEEEGRGNISSDRSLRISDLASLADLT